MDTAMTIDIKLIALLAGLTTIGFAGAGMYYSGKGKHDTADQCGWIAFIALCIAIGVWG